MTFRLGRKLVLVACMTRQCISVLEAARAIPLKGVGRRYYTIDQDGITTDVKTAAKAGQGCLFFIPGAESHFKT